MVKVEPSGGDPARTAPVDDVPVNGVSPLFVHLNAGKRITTDSDVDWDAAIGWADIVLDDRVGRQVRNTPLDPDALAHRGTVRVLATATAWGFDADDPGRLDEELLVQAASGALTATGDAGREPLRLPGWQSQYLAGGYALAGALACLSDGGFHHVETTWAGAMLTGVEAGLCAYLYQEDRPDDAGRQGGFQVGAFPAGAWRCADGHVVPGTVRPVDWPLQCKVYGRPELADDERFRTPMARNENREALIAEIQAWLDAHGKREIFEAGLEEGWAVAMVMTAADALDDPHLADRRFVSDLAGGGKIAGRPWRSAEIPENETVEVREAGRIRFPAPEEEGGFRGADVAGLKVLELTWAWAGPFVGRFLGTRGADVVRVETGGRPDAWRTRMRWRDVGTPVPEGVDPDDYTWDAAALFNTLNRNKRAVSVDLSHADGREVFVRLVRQADLLVVNMGHSVLADRGVEDDVLAAVDDGLVVLTMPALGATGPYRAMPGYGMLMEGMGGLSARFGYDDEGARASSTYYPDAVAGLHGVVASLAALAARDSTGRGTVIDLSQQEVTWLQMGESIVLRSLEGRETGRLGNREPGLPDSGFERDNGGWRAVLDNDRAVPFLTWRDAYRNAVLAERGLVERVGHPVTGERAYLSVPVTIDGAPLATRRRAPTFDEHTDEVLQEWAALPSADVAALRASEAVGTRPTRRRR